MFHVSEQISLELERERTDPKASEVTKYRLERPVVANQHTSLALRFASGLKRARVSVAYDADAVLTSDLANPNGDAAVEFRIPLPSGARFDSLSIEGLNPSDSLEWAGLKAHFAGVDYERGIVDSRIGHSVVRGNPHTSYSLDFSKIVSTAKGNYQVEIAYGYNSDGVPDRQVTLVAKRLESAKSYSLRPRSGDSKVYLYSTMLGFIPHKIEITGLDSNVILKSVHVRNISSAGTSIPKPLPIDMGVLIGAGNGSWRREDYELYTWNLYPEILIIDTRSYAVQSAFFKRLAFFVEKAESAGSLVSDSYLDGKHGWNAHDYQAGDLARFFTRAVREGFVLDKSELHLLEILLANDIVRRSGNEYVAGTGGLISLSQESEPRLRSLFMIHEGYHGVFFSELEYRDAVFSVWEGLSDVEQGFWREFLLFRNYNIDDTFLVVNELQAYLMQISADRLDAYYWDYSVPGLVQYVPRTAKLIETLKAEYPDTFHRSASQVETVLRKYAGIGAEDLFCLEETE